MADYTRIHWVDGPEGGTPISGANLNKMDLHLSKALAVPDGISEGVILVYDEELGWKPVPIDSYITKSAVVVRGVLASSSQLPSHAVGGEGFLVENGEGYDLYVWVDAALTQDGDPWVNTGPMNNIQGPAGPRGIQGPPGAGLRILGSLASEGDLAGITDQDTGDAYLINEEMWVWDGESWNNTGNVGQFDHSALSGLENDDHPQYALVEGTRKITVGPVEPEDPDQGDIWGDTKGHRAIFTWDDEYGWTNLAPQTNSTTYTHDIRAQLPSPSEHLIGSWFWAADEDQMYYCDGFDWHLINETITHNQLKGLEDDDHPQYLTEDRGNDRYLKLSGGQITGNLELPNVKIGMSTLPSSGASNLDFDGPGFLNQGPLTGNVSYTTSNIGSGKTVTVRVRGGAAQRTLTFPTQWAFIGVKPTAIAANKTGVLTVTCFGDSASDLVAAWSFEL